MDKETLVRNVSRKTGFYQQTVSLVFESIFEEIKDGVANGERVKVPSFGTFESVVQSARTGRNVRTGEAVHIPERKTPGFKPYSNFKELVRRKSEYGN